MKKINYLAEFFFFACLIGVLYLWYVVYKPFLGVVLIAAALTTLFYPLYLKLLRKYRKMSSTVASGLMVMFVFFLVLIPFGIFVFYLSTQVSGVYNWLSTIINQETLNNFLVNINELTEKLFHFTFDKSVVLENLSETISSFNKSLLSISTLILNNLVQTTSNFFFLLITMFFMFKDGKTLLVRIMTLTPLYDRYDMEIYRKFQDVSSSALMATFVTAIVQGIVGGIGYAIIGLPFLFLGLATGVASVIPLIGTFLAWGPIVLYLLVIGSWWQAIFLGIWGVVVIGLTDNFLRPWLMKGKTKIHPMILFFGILGGIFTFGFWGIIYGPLIIAIGLTLLHIYSLEYASVLKANKFNFYKSTHGELAPRKKKKVGRPKKKKK